MSHDLHKALALALAAQADANKALAEALFIALDIGSNIECKHEDKTRTGTMGSPGGWVCNNCGAEGK